MYLITPQNILNKKMQQIKLMATIWGYKKILPDDIFNLNEFEINFEDRLELKISNSKDKGLEIVGAIDRYGDCLDEVKNSLFTIKKITI